MDIKKLFSQMSVNTLKQLAISHNIQTSIKAPSQMLKAELIKSLSDHYFELKGTTLLPVKNEIGLTIPWNDLPAMFKPKNPNKPKKITETEEDVEEFNRLKKLEDWAKQHVKIKQAPYDISKEKRKESAYNKYTSDKEIAEAIKRREIRQLKAKETRKLKTSNKKPTEAIINPKISKAIEEDEEIQNPLIDKLTALLNRFTYLNNKEKIQKDDIEYYNNTLDRYDEIMKLYNKTKKTLSKADMTTINKLFEKIDNISNDDNFNDRFI